MLFPGVHALYKLALDKKPLFVPAHVTHPRVQGDLLYSKTLSAKQESCTKNASKFPRKALLLS